MSKALVTGGTGFVGSHVVRHLLKEGQDVRCLVRNSPSKKNLEGLSVELTVGDLLDRPSLSKAVQGCDLLFHVAADYRLWSPDPKELERTNVEGSRHLFEAAMQAGVSRIVFTSSVAAIGRPEKNGNTGVGDETMDPTPEQLIGPYKRSKFMADRLARDLAAQGYPIVIVNPSTPVGSHDIKPTPTGKIIVDFLNGKMPGYVDTGLNFVDARDVAAGHWLAAQKGKVGERYILGNQNLSLREFLTLAAKQSNRRPPRWRIPYAVAWMAGAVSTALSRLTGKEPAIPLDGVRMTHAPMYYDGSKAVRELGLPQTPVQDAVKSAINWFQENGYIQK